MRLSCLTLLASLLATGTAEATDPALRLDDGRVELTLSCSMLLKRSDLRRISVSPPAFRGERLEVQALPLAQLMGLPAGGADGLIEYECADGFAGVLPAAKVADLQPLAAHAFLAIEDPAHPWPRLAKPPHADAGPFYLVWTDPEKSSIGPEQWPYQVVRLALRPAVAESYPAILPRKRGGAVERGLRVFLANCFSCHPINGAGAAHVGPDLNVPSSPVEYLQPWALERQIRDPQTLRRWPQGRMPAFPREVLSDEAVADLVAYFRELAAERTPPK